jgi:hypothetical protein
VILVSDLKLNLFLAPVKMCKRWSWQPDDRFTERRFLPHPQGHSDLWSNHPWLFNRMHLNLIKRKNKYPYGFINKMCLTFSLIYLFQHIASLNQKGILGFQSSEWLSGVPSYLLVYVHRGGLSLSPLFLFWL